MITLFGARRAWGQPNASTFATKVEIHLRMAGIAYEMHSGMVFGPKGKIPFIEDEGEKVCDSSFIRWHIERKYGFDFNAGYTATELGAAWAFEKLCEDNLYWSLVHMRWSNAANFDKGPRDFFRAVPALLRPLVVAMIRRKVTKQLHAQGFGRHSDAEVARLAIEGLKAISVFLGEKPFLLGADPCGADAMVYASVFGLMCPRFDSPIRDAAATMPNLVAYCDRMTKRYFPEGL